MSSHLRPGPSHLFPGFLAVSIFGAGALFVKTTDNASTSSEARQPGLVALIRASARDVPTPPPAARTDASPIRVSVDSTSTSTADATAWRAISDRLAVMLDEPDEEAPSPTRDVMTGRGGRNWIQWARLQSTPAPVYWESIKQRDMVDIFAVSSREGASVCLSNRSTTDAVIRLRVRLAQGPYKLERLIFTPRVDTEHVMFSTVGFSARKSNVRGADVRMVRLKGRDVPHGDVEAVPLTLRSGEICLLRFTNSAYASRVALNEVRDQLRKLQRASGDLAHRLHVIFDGSGAFENAISPSCHLSLDRRRAVIHRFLLVLGQAYALHRNFQDRNAVRLQAGVQFRAALDGLNDALADVSATLMGLVPDIFVSQNAPVAGQPGTHRSYAIRRGDDSVHTAYVTIALANLGSRSVEFVKIGIDQSALPPGVHCEPAEPALFGALAPAQTVRATYLLRWSGPETLPENRCIGDISYFTAGAPAHLRPRPW